MLTFSDLYNLEKYTTIPDSKTKKGKSSIYNVCRFCGNTDNLYFKNKSHTIPQALGNKYLISSDECDICNKTFGRYETYLTNYLEIIRAIYTFQATKEFNAPNKDFKIQRLAQEPNSKLFLTTENNVRESSDGLTISIKANSYIPIYVYRLLLKIGLSLIDEQDIYSYKKTCRLLIDKSKYDILNHMARKVCKYTLFDKTLHTHFIIFKRKPNVKKFPKHVLLIAYYNTILQLPIPYYNEDAEVYQFDFDLPYATLEQIYESGSGVKYNKEIVDLSHINKMSHIEEFSLAFEDTQTQEIDNPILDLRDDQLFINPNYSDQIVLIPLKNKNKSK